MIFLCDEPTDRNIRRQAPIRFATTAVHREQLNGEFVLEFDGIIEERVNDWLGENTVFEARNNYFDVVRSESKAESDGTYTMNAEAEHVSYRLNNEDWNLTDFNQTGTAFQLLQTILNGTGFTIGIVDVENPDATHNQQSAGESSRRKLLMELATLVRGELEFDKFTISLRHQRGSPSVRPIVQGRHVNVISRGFDKSQRDEETGEPERFYNCESLHLPMNDYSLGDTLRLMNSKLRVNRVLRLVSITHNPYDDTDVIFELYTGPKKWFGRGLEGLIDDIIDELDDIEHGVTEPAVEAIPPNLFDPYQDEFETDFMRDRVVVPASIKPPPTTSMGGHYPELINRKFILMKGNEIRWLQSELVDQRNPITSSQAPEWWTEMPDINEWETKFGKWDGQWREEWGPVVDPDFVEGEWPKTWPAPWASESEAQFRTAWKHRGQQVYWVFSPGVEIFLGVTRGVTAPQANRVNFFTLSPNTPTSGTVKLGADTISYTDISGNSLTGVTGVQRSHPQNTSAYAPGPSASEWDGPNTPMTKTDPVLFNPPDYGDTPPEQRESINIAHRNSHIVEIWNLNAKDQQPIEQEDPPIPGGKGYVEIWRRIPTVT